MPSSLSKLLYSVYDVLVDNLSDKRSIKFIIGGCLISLVIYKYKQPRIDYNPNYGKPFPSVGGLPIFGIIPNMLFSGKPTFKYLYDLGRKGKNQSFALYFANL